MNVLLLGSGGREHALAWKLAASPLTDQLWCAPGNAGIAQEAVCVPLDIADHQAVIAFCKANKIDFVMVGPEVPLCAGIVDDLEAAGIKAFGPSKAAARLEGSKGFTKDLCREFNIPTAAYERFAAAAPAARSTSLAKDLEPSISAAPRPGPKTLMPEWRNSSATPATSGASGPTTTRSILLALQNAITAPWSVKSSAASSHSLAMPALPGAQ